MREKENIKGFDKEEREGKKKPLFVSYEIKSSHSVADLQINFLSSNCGVDLTFSCKQCHGPS